MQGVARTAQTHRGRNNEGDGSEATFGHLAQPRLKTIQRNIWDGNFKT